MITIDYMWHICMYLRGIHYIKGLEPLGFAATDLPVPVVCLRLDFSDQL